APLGELRGRAVVAGHIQGEWLLETGDERVQQQLGGRDVHGEEGTHLAALAAASQDAVPGQLSVPTQAQRASLGLREPGAQERVAGSREGARIEFGDVLVADRRDLARTARRRAAALAAVAVRVAGGDVAAALVVRDLGIDRVEADGSIAQPLVAGSPQLHPEALAAPLPAHDVEADEAERAAVADAGDHR